MLLLCLFVVAAVLLSLEAWFEVEIEELTGRELVKVKLVCHPHGLLADNHLTNFIAQSNSGLRALRFDEFLETEVHNYAFPNGPLREFEAVVQLPPGMTMDKLDSILQALEASLVAKCRGIANQAFLPRFEVGDPEDIKIHELLMAGPMQRVVIGSYRLVKLKLVCTPRWLLGRNSLTAFIAQSSSELCVVAPEEAERAFPNGPLRDFEAVVELPAGMSMEEVGCILHALMERRRSLAGEETFYRRHRLPRFQVVASIGNSFLHFGGSVGCGKRRWRSCPASMV